MNAPRHIENLIRKLKYTAGDEVREKVLQELVTTLEESTGATPTADRSPGSKIPLRATVAIAAAAAAIVFVVLGGKALLPGGHPGGKAWWLEPPAAWAHEILTSLEEVEVLVHRERFVFVGKFGSTHISGNWTRTYTGQDRRRIDTYYGDTLVGRKWELPEADGSQTHYHVNFEYDCYGIAENQGGPPSRDPVEPLRYFVRLLEKRNRLLGVETVDGRRHVGFEVSAATYGSNPEEWTDRIWFDEETKLPVRIERLGRPISSSPEQDSARILDQFDYHGRVRADFFEPEIPEGFVKVHPDEIRAERERQEEGDMVYADVPEGLKEELVAALDQIEAVSYREPPNTRMSLTRHAWRADQYEGEDLKQVHWYVIAKDDMAPTSFDFNDKGFCLAKTTVDFEGQTYKQVAHGRETRPPHPMDMIRFLVGQVDRADRILEDTLIDGTACTGLEISAKKYGTNPDDMIHRLWFSLKTHLPVRMEVEYMPDGATEKVVHVLDQFEWNPTFPPAFFVPEIPAGFAAAEGSDGR